MSLRTAGSRLLVFIRQLRTRLQRGTIQAEPPYAGVIREATECIGSPSRAAAFRDANGLSRLEEAIETAEADNHPELARTGRQALHALQRQPSTRSAGRGSDIPPEQ